MDLLASILKQAGLQRRILNQRAFYQPVSMKFPCVNSIGFHVVTFGECYLHTESSSKKVIHLKKGDMALMARGFSHIVSTQPQIADVLIDVSEKTEDSLPFKEDEKSKLTLVSGAYQFWHAPLHPFFHEIPDWFVIRSEDIAQHDHLQMIIKLLSEEVSKSEMGSESIIQALLDIIFSLILRKVVEANRNRPETFAYAMQDPQIFKTLERLHADCAQAWTLETMARQAGLSRAGFAQKFKKALGETPLHYLTKIRVQKAMDLLSNGTDTIEVVAASVGYVDAFSFSKVFKKVVGVPPKQFRMKDKEDRNLSWRYL